MKQIILSFGLFLVCGLAPLSQSSAQTGSKSINDQVDGVFKRWNKSDSPGCALGVIKDGELIYKRGYGMADIERKVPITPSTVFNIGSITKQFTAACIALLAQQGKISLEDNIRKYVPEIPEFRAPITIRHLVHQTSGLRDFYDLTEIAGRDYETAEQGAILELLAGQKELNFNPNEQHLYCNGCYDLLAIIVKRASGLSLHEFAERNIFKPLGMIHTTIKDNRTIPPNSALSYEPNSNKFRLRIPNDQLVGSHGVWTTIEDLLLWDQNFYSGKIGGQSFIEQMYARGVLNDGNEIDYAFGLNVGHYRGLKTVAHAGGDIGYRSQFSRFPDQKFSFICLCNTYTSPGGLVEKVADLYLADRFKNPVREFSKSPAPLRLSKQELAAKTGVYWNEEERKSIRVYLEDGKLRLAIGSNHYTLLPLNKNRFQLLGYPDQICFDPPDVDKPQWMRHIDNNGEVTSYGATNPPALTWEQLKEYAGAYRSEELKSGLTINLMEGRIRLIIDEAAQAKSEPHSLDGTVLELLPLFADTYQCGHGCYLNFMRNSQRKVTGFKLNMPYTNFLLFSKTPNN
jgi:CubicO group peptidase (beta-lactamase class C family)